jgi:hypothetical protein
MEREQAAERASKRAYRIHELKGAGGPGHAKAYGDIRKGLLRAVKMGRSTLILADDFERYLAALPAIVPTKSDVPPDDHERTPGQAHGRRHRRRRKPREIKSV